MGTLTKHSALSTKKGIDLFNQIPTLLGLGEYKHSDATDHPFLLDLVVIKNGRSEELV